MNNQQKQKDLEDFDEIQNRISDQIISMVNGNLRGDSMEELDYIKTNLLAYIRELENKVRGYL